MSVPVLSFDISSSMAFLVGTWVEGPLFGLNIAIYIAYIRILSKDITTQEKLLIAVATFQIVVATAHFITTILDLIGGFITHYIVSSFLFTTNYVIGDAILAWRCYIVWGQNQFIRTFFLVIVTGAFIAGYANIGHIAALSKTQAVFVVYHWTVASFAISLGIQISATLLIVWKIWRTTSWASPASGHRERLTFLWIIIESGALLATATVAVLVMFVLHMNAGAIVSYILT
ncbi:uncharacterized protein PHACADRAFT_189446 [Phanerochaete carnosa HHB-10118-sp]|uniref:Uncharacterized protein n=1 Tax=Phanerochaete carnosa (strain HHB-10118-sp) TaxID=650164 RepID=K5WLM8_PHACS|nr:uncharacterized protein PHACADRAFT_189446 [Phanerochaete carnosa HHB-10118-sp]EKM60305.1 hypothetical protein PHACADRAFT_189446 [Phanerochaete carnosa HHB-10118-sp]